MRHSPNVLLINPWIVDFTAYDSWAKPIGLLTLGGILRENGYRVDLLDCMDRGFLKGCTSPAAGKPGANGTGHYHKEFIPKPPVFSSIPRRYGRYGMPKAIVRDELERRRRPDLVLLTSGMTYWYPGVVEMTSLVRSLFPGVPVVLGGIYATLCTDHARIASGADAVVAGEGESRILPLADAMTGHRSAGEDYGNPDAVPFLPYDLYTRLESAAILTSRGCPYRCPFCASHLLCSGYSRRNPIRVVDEMVSIQRTMGAGHFAFYDDALLYQKEAHFVPLLDEWIGRRCEAFLHTPNGIHPKWVDVPLAKLMKRAGFKTVRLGYETQQPTLQQAMGKVTDGDLVQAVSCFLEAGFTRSEIGAYVIMGLPGQTAADILDSILFVMRLGIKIGTAFFSPIPGTASWAEAVRRGFSRDGEDPLLSNHAVFPMRSSSLDLAGFIRIGTLAAMGNRIVSLGGKPTEYPEFTKQLTRLERA